MACISKFALDALILLKTTPSIAQLAQCTAIVAVGSFASIPQRTRGVRSTPMNGHCQIGPVGPFRAKGGHAPSRNSDNGRSSCVVVTLCCGACFFLDGNSAHYFEDTLTLHPFSLEARRLTDMPEEILSLP